MRVDRLIITARAQTVPSPLSSEAIVERAAKGSRDVILLATGKVGAGEQYIQAAEALQRHGIAGIIAPAFAWPFFRLCLNIGLPPLTLWEAGEIQDGRPAADRCEQPHCEIPERRQPLSDSGPVRSVYRDAGLWRAGRLCAGAAGGTANGEFFGRGTERVNVSFQSTTTLDTFTLCQYG